ncbi:MAG: class I SAM-dependent methyltransferase [Verrucomicrobia bacterium]|jgi:predicted O-methyltransferase YrrM|nr:class I SAM-dependent methyltransferase [Verrucomicrobiota bacterium]
MKRLKRREFLGVSGGAFLAWMGAMGSLPLSGEAASASSSRRASVDPMKAAARKELMRSMEAERLLTGLNNTRENAHLLHLLIRMSHAYRVLEVGTYKGYSTLWMATALEAQGGGKLTTIEIDRMRVLEAKRNMRDCGVDSIVTCLEGDAHQEVKKLKKNFDLIFLDADRDRNEDYLQTLWPLLRTGGFLCLNGAVRFRGMMKRYFEELEKKKDAMTTILKTLPNAELLSAESEGLGDAMSITWKQP